MLLSLRLHLVLFNPHQALILIFITHTSYLKNMENSYCKPSISEVINLIETAPDTTSILVDFDETLFLRNSTQEYLNSLQPRIIGSFFLALLGLLKPWNYLPNNLKGDVSRDWLKVVLATLFFPWTLILWQFKAKKLARTYGNTTLIEGIEKNPKSPVIISSLGFHFIIRPIVKHLSIKIDRIICCRFWQGGSDRHRGKLAMTTTALGKNVVKDAILITDSNDDLPLLSYVSKPCLFVWSEAKNIHAMSDVYIPFFYLEKVKKPDQPYFINEILGNDLLFLVLASSWISSQPILHILSMTFLMLSFWCIYETGYMENDLVAEKFEKKPKLTDTYQRYKTRINLWQPWIWSLLFASLGILLLELSKKLTTNPILNLEFVSLHGKNILINAGFWVSLLIFVRVIFWIYNHIDKKTRIWLYPVLQACRCFGFLTVTGSNIVGTMIFAAHVISRWIPYMIYRYAKVDGWPKNIAQLFRVLIFGLLVTAVALGTQDVSILISWQTFIIFTYCAYRGRRLPLEIIRSAHPVWKDQWGTDNFVSK